MKDYLINLLECPNCHGKLSWNIMKKYENEIDEAQATCEICFSTYPVKQGIGLFINKKITENDPWETAESQLMMMFKQYPQIERKLLNCKNETASPNDLFLKALLLEERGSLIEAKSIYEIAQKRCYTPETLYSVNSQFEYVINNIHCQDQPIIDFASGRCNFAEELALRTKNPIVITDISPRVLRRNLDYFKAIGKYDKVSLIAIDACNTPFKNKSIMIMTTFLGLINIENSERLPYELKRVIDGNFFAIHIFYPDDEGNNAKAIKKAKIDKFAFKQSALQYFSSANLDIDIKNVISTYEKPSEPGKIIQGAIVNKIPAGEVISEWCTIMKVV